jgi:hypothetical protein
MTARNAVNRFRPIAGPASATVSAVLTLLLLAGAPNASEEALGQHYRLDRETISEVPSLVAHSLEEAVETSLQQFRPGEPHVTAE